MVGKQPITKLKVDLKPISLDKSNLEKLCNIVLKAADEDSRSTYVRFEIEGKSETVEANSIDSLVNATLPRDVKEIKLYASGKNGKDINIYISDIGDAFGIFSNITISGKDTDWVSARTRELEDFIADHKNFHWIFQNWVSVIIQALALAGLIAYTMGDNKWGVMIGMFSSYAYILLVRKIFPLVMLDTGRPSNLKTVRKVLVYIIPAIFVGLIVTLITQLIQLS